MFSNLSAQAESKVNIQPLVRLTASSTPNVPRINSSAFRTDSSRERLSSSVKFEVKPSRSYSNTQIDDGSTEQSLQFNENNAVRLVFGLFEQKENFNGFFGVGPIAISTIIIWTAK